MPNIICAQLNMTVGDTAGNKRQILDAIATAKKDHAADLILFPELALSGYPPEDILYRQDYLDSIDQALAEIQLAAQDIVVVVGHPFRNGSGLYNAASVFENQTVLARYCKQFLPNTEVFDEYRYFKPGEHDTVFTLKGVRVALAICEDIWHTQMIEKIRLLQADVLLVINASPFSENKPRLRHELLSDASAYLEHPVIYLNLVGGQDQLVFDGGSCAYDRSGKCVSQAPWSETCLWPVKLNEIDGVYNILPGMITAEPDHVALMYRAIVLGTRDYCLKNGFREATLGLSGGIDSALTLAILADALGPSAVHPIYLPSQYSRDISLQGAQDQCDRMGISLQTLSIDAVVKAVDTSLSSLLGNLSPMSAQNVQSRARAILLMGVSNQTGALLISTGNKTEFAVGYTTLYGDMSGGFAPLKDVYKTDVYALAQYRNSVSSIIPDRVIAREPSAELAPNQLDSDDLPPYPALDAVLKAYIEGQENLADIAAPDIDMPRIIRRIYLSEYKRQQAPPGPKVTSLAFGRERRYPMTNGFKG